MSSLVGRNDSWFTAGTAQNVGTVLPVANLMVDSESRTLIFYSSLIVTIGLSRLVSEIFTCNTQTDKRRDNAYCYYSCSPFWQVS